MSEHLERVLSWEITLPIAEGRFYSLWFETFSKRQETRDRKTELSNRKRVFEKKGEESIILLINTELIKFSPKLINAISKRALKATKDYYKLCVNKYPQNKVFILLLGGKGVTKKS